MLHQWISFWRYSVASIFDLLRKLQVAVVT
jgi:hypothetical protein